MAQSSRRATAKIADDRDELVAFFDYPAEHWIHLHTTNPDIGSTFATVRLRTRVTKGEAGSRAAGSAMAFKLIESTPHRWRAVNAPQLVALVRARRCSSTPISSNDPTSPPLRAQPKNLDPSITRSIRNQSSSDPPAKTYRAPDASGQ